MHRYIHIIHKQLHALHTVPMYTVYRACLCCVLHSKHIFLGSICVNYVRGRLLCTRHVKQPAWGLSPFLLSNTLSLISCVA